MRHTTEDIAVSDPHNPMCVRKEEEVKAFSYIFIRRDEVILEEHIVFKHINEPIVLEMDSRGEQAWQSLH